MERYLRIQLLRPSGFAERPPQRRNEGSCCSFPQFEVLFSREGEETGDTMKTRSMEGTSSEKALASVATILEQKTRATINDWFQRNMVNDLLSCSPLEQKACTSHLPKLFRDLVTRLRCPLPARTRTLASPSAAAYGILRRKQKYTAAMLVEEARMLEVSIFHTLYSNAYRIDFSMLLPDVMVIADEVDSQLAQAIASYNTV
jgi:hypothetical protein